MYFLDSGTSWSGNPEKLEKRFAIYFLHPEKVTEKVKKVSTLVFLINVQARLFFGGSISPLHTHFYLVPARLLGTTYILIRPTLPISRLHAYLALHVY